MFCYLNKIQGPGTIPDDSGPAQFKLKDRSGCHFFLGFKVQYIQDTGDRADGLVGLSQGGSESNT